MKLLRLTYKNFKAQSQNIILNDSDVDVFGANGAGKTTAFDAFIWLLFGKDSKGAELSEDIKTRSQVDNGQEHEVEAVLLLDDGGHIKLKRTFREIWTKKRGSATETFSGHTTDFFIDDVPAKKREYSDRINSIISEEKFKLLTDPLYFKNQMDWKDRRKILLEVCGDVSDEDVIASKEELAELPDMLAGKSIEDYRKILQARRTKMNDELRKIPVRIDEAQRNLPDVEGLNAEVIQTELEDFKKTQMELNRKILKIQDGGAAADKQREIAELDTRQAEIKNRYDHEVNKKALLNLSVISELNSKKNRMESGIDDSRKKIEFLQKVITSGGEKLQQLRAEWKEINAEQFTASVDDTCPTCGQKLPADRVEAAMQQALEGFNFSKSNLLAENSKTGKATKAKLIESGEQIEKLQADIAGMQAKIAETDKEIERLKAETDEVKEYQNDVTYCAAEAQKSRLRKEIDDLNKDTSIETNKLQAEIRSLDTDVQSRQEKLALIKTNHDGKARIEELQEEQKKLVVEFEELEHALYQTDLFIKTKVSMLDKKINSKFRIAQFRLFETQVNGGLSECCDVLYDGVARMSNSQEIKVGLDVIRTLSKHYGISTPIFVDNCESITELPPMDGQVIRLIVSAEDKELRIERKDKEQAAA